MSISKLADLEKGFIKQFLQVLSEKNPSLEKIQQLNAVFWSCQCGRDGKNALELAIKNRKYMIVNHFYIHCPDQDAMQIAIQIGECIKKYQCFEIYDYLGDIFMQKRAGHSRGATSPSVTSFGHDSLTGSQNSTDLSISSSQSGYATELRKAPSQHFLLSSLEEEIEESVEGLQLIRGHCEALHESLNSMQRNYLTLLYLGKRLYKKGELNGWILVKDLLCAVSLPAFNPEFSAQDIGRYSNEIYEMFIHLPLDEDFSIKEFFKRILPRYALLGQDFSKEVLKARIDIIVKYLIIGKDIPPPFTLENSKIHIGLDLLKDLLKNSLFTREEVQRGAIVFQRLCDRLQVQYGSDASCNSCCKIL